MVFKEACNKGLPASDRSVFRLYLAPLRVHSPRSSLQDSTSDGYVISAFEEVSVGLDAHTENGGCDHHQLRHNRESESIAPYSSPHAIH